MNKPRFEWEKFNGYSVSLNTDIPNLMSHVHIKDYTLRDAPIVAFVQLCNWLEKNKAIDAFDIDQEDTVIYLDKKCEFQQRFSYHRRSFEYCLTWLSEALNKADDPSTGLSEVLNGVSSELDTKTVVSNETENIIHKEVFNEKRNWYNPEDIDFGPDTEFGQTAYGGLKDCPEDMVAPPEEQCNCKKQPGDMHNFNCPIYMGLSGHAHGFSGANPYPLPPSDEDINGVTILTPTKNESINKGIISCTCDYSASTMLQIAGEHRIYCRVSRHA